MKKYFICIFLLIVVTGFSGCISYDGLPQKTIGLYYGKLSNLNYTEIMSINDSYVKNEVEKLNYTLTITYNPEFALYPDCTKSVAIRNNGSSGNNFLQILIQAYNDTNRSWGLIEIAYDNPHIAEDKIGNYTKSKVKEVATICNITINVDEIKWTTSYED